MAQCSKSQGYTIQPDSGNVNEIRQLVAESIAYFGKLDILVK